MRLPANDGDRPPSQHLLDKRLDIRQIRLIVKRRAPVMANNPIQFLPRPGQHIGKRAAGEHKSDQCRAGRVTSRAKQVPGQRCDFLLGKLVFWCFVEDFARVALFLVRVGGSFFGQRVEELMSAASSSQAMFPWCNLGGEFGQNYTY